MLCYSEIVVDPSVEELKICDGMAHMISNRSSQLGSNINIEGMSNIKIHVVATTFLYCYIAGIIGDESDIKKCLETAPKLFFTLKTLLNSVCVS